MAKLFAFLLLILAAISLYFDWNQTVSLGETFAPTRLGSFWEAHSPTSLERLRQSFGGALTQGNIDKLLYVPLAALLAVVAGLFWMIGRRPEPRRKSFGR